MGRSRMRIGQWASVACGLVLIAVSVVAAAGNLLAVDLGSGYLKVAVARPGKGLELVTNEASKRKTPTVVAFTLDGERLFGDPALAYAPKAPTRAILAPLGYLGNASARVEIPAGATSSAPALTLTGVDLVAMILALARQHAAAALGAPESSVRDTVVTVPAWYSAPHRAALADAATVAGLNVLALVNSNAAAALKYALDNKASVAPAPSATASSSPSPTAGASKEKDAHFALFVDVGAGSTVATVVQIDNKKSGRSATKLPSAVTVLSHGWDRTLGGRALDDVIVARLVTAFDKQRGLPAGSDQSAAHNPRVVTRLRKEAQKVREMLSANMEAHVAVASLVGDEDLTSTVVSRADFESDAASTLARITAPVTRALASAGITADQLDAVVPLGGASRTPKLQQLLCEALGRSSLNKSVNADEAAVMGAAFLAASLSPTFRVRALDLADVSPRAVSVAVRREPGTASAGAGEFQNATLFAAGSKRPATKKLTVRRKDDFTLSLFLEPLPSSSEGAAMGAEADTGAMVEDTSDLERALYGRYTVAGVSKVLAKRRSPASETDASPKVTLSFLLDHSGLVRVESAEATLEETVWTTPTPTPTPSADASPDAKSKKKAKESPTPEGSPKPVAKTIIHRQSLVVTELPAVVGDIDGNVGGWRLSEPDLATSRATLAALDAAANDRTARADALNALEGLVLQARASLRLGGDDSDALEVVSTEAEREALIELLDAAEDWMYTDAASSTTALVAKKAEVSAAVSPLFTRAADYAARPNAVASLREALAQSATLTTAARAARDVPSGDSDEVKAAAEKVLAAAESAAAAATAWLADVESAASGKLATGDVGYTAAQVDEQAVAVRRAAAAVRKLPSPLPVASPSPSAAEAGTDGSAASGEPVSAADSPSPAGSGDPKHDEL
ncbi:hypothetical protein MMPV_004528 [Pyropia vietnamensis]